MKKIIALLLVALFSIGAYAAEGKPKIGMKRATEIATKRVHGTIKSKELEKEQGRWIYSFDISTGKGKITEVAIDAYTGKVTSVKTESAAAETKEAKDEMKMKH